MNLPLDGQHRALGAKMTEYAGCSMPLHYGDILREHKTVRESCGLFDCSHMGEFLITGSGAVRALNTLLSNRFDDLKPGRARYAVACNEQGGTVDDLIVYHTAPEEYLVVVNAANRQKDFAWFSEHIPAGDVTLQDLSDAYALLALQGPRAEDVLSGLGAKNLPKRYFGVSADAQAAGLPLIAARTGYTGEDGFELFCKPSQVGALWDALLEAGEPFGCKPCGLGARDTLRLEASLPLYGHELGEDISPLEAGLDFAVKLDKPSFIGRDALQKPSKRYLAGLRATGRGILREHCEVFREGVRIGLCSSGTFCPSLGVSAAMAFLEGERLPEGTEVEVDVRGRRVAAVVVSLPLYKREIR